MLRSIAATASFFSCLVGASVAHAHAFAPSLLVLQERSRGEVEVTWKTPRLRVMGSDVRPRLPESCRDGSTPVTEEGETAVTLRWRVDCGPAGLVGSRVAIEGLASANTNGFIRVLLADGRMLQHVVTIAAPSVSTPQPLQRDQVSSRYVSDGISHVLGRPDRILFLVGLFLLAPTARLLWQTLCAFTIGHSATFPAAALGLIAIPSRVIEIVLAVTILMLATELARASSNTLMRRYPWAVGFGFGLLHGLAFAAVFRQSVLPSADVPLAVLSFNVGIEMGQLILVSALLIGAHLLRRLAVLPQWAHQVPIYVMGSLGAFWCFERAAALLR